MSRRNPIFWLSFLKHKHTLTKYVCVLSDGPRPTAIPKSLNYGIADILLLGTHGVAGIPWHFRGSPSLKNPHEKNGRHFRILDAGNPASHPDRNSPSCPLRKACDGGLAIARKQNHLASPPKRPACKKLRYFRMLHAKKPI